MTDNTDTQDHGGTAADTEDDEFDDLFNFTSPSTLTTEATDVVPPRASSSPIHFGLGSDSDSSDSELDDSVPPPNSKNNTSLESSSYYEVSSSTGTSTPSTDEPKEGGDPFVTGNVSGVLEDTKPSSLMSLERQGEDAFLEMDEGTREMLDWLDKPGSSAPDTTISAKSDIEGNTNDEDLDFVDIHMPDNLKEEKAEDDSDRAKETLIILGEEEEQTAANLPTVTIIPEEEERNQNLSPNQLIPTAPVASKIAPVSHQFDAILTESYSADEDDFDGSSNNEIKKGIEGNDDDLSESGSDISDLFLTEENEYDEEEEEEDEDLTFANISEAVRSTQSNVQKHILPFLQAESNVSVDDRPWLWTKAICGKILTDVKSSSLADSFVSWDTSFHLIDLEQNANLSKFGVDTNFVKKLLKEVDCLADRIVTAKCEDTEEAKNRAKRDLSSLLLFYYHSGTTISENANEENESSEYGDMEQVIDNTTEDKDSTSKQKQNEEASKTSIKAVEWNSLIGPIAATLLSSSVCVSVASVMLSTIIPVAMPLVSLTTTERLDAAKKIHSTFYLLVCYHLPMLVLHLDRYCPGWHWPKEEQDGKDREENQSESPTRKSRNLETQGIIPTTWFTSQLAGECTVDGTKTTTEIKPDQLLRLWDILLISNDNSLPFFLALRMLEKHSYKLLMLRGEIGRAHV